MKEIIVKDAALRKAAEGGMDAFIQVFTDAIYDSIGELTTETLSLLNSNQVTLLAYQILRDEVMDGGFVQLIHNGYGPFFFQNPFARAVKLWGLRDLSKLVYSVKDLYRKNHETIEKDCTDEEFMALFEQFPEFDNYDDEFVENEEQWTETVAQYVDDHLDRFATILE
ncbi:MAG: DMP19 family protein [Prevotella sp.]|nr:DMP19 family protein [Prevotella sp.]